MSATAAHPAENDPRKELIKDQLAATEVYLAAAQEPVDVTDTIKLPIDRLPELGVAFASLPAMFRSITTTMSLDVPGLV